MILNQISLLVNKQKKILSSINHRESGTNKFKFYVLDYFAMFENMLPKLLIMILYKILLWVSEQENSVYITNNSESSTNKFKNVNY